MYEENTVVIQTSVTSKVVMTAVLLVYGTVGFSSMLAGMATPVGKGNSGSAPGIVKKAFSCDVAPFVEPDFKMSGLGEINKHKENVLSEAMLLRENQNSKGEYSSSQQKKVLEGRKKVIREALAYNPEAALPGLLSKKERTIINSFSENCVEEEVVLEGVIEYTIADDFENDFSKEWLTLKTNDNKKFNIHPIFERKDEFETGQTIRVKGIRLDNEIIFNAKSDTHTSSFLGGYDILATPGNPPVIGVKKTLVVPVLFTGSPNYTFNVSAMVTVMNEVRDYFSEVSYDIATISGVMNANQGADVLDFIQIPIETTCSFTAAGDEALKIIELYNGVNINDYDKFLIVAPFPSCGWAGVATIGGNMAGIRIASAFSPGLLEHELGHLFGSHHANFLQCGTASLNDSSCFAIEYGDLYDVMGSTSNTGHLNALHKEYFEWLSEDDIIDVTESGVYKIAPIELTTSTPQVLKLQTSYSQYLYIEYRQPIGQDSNLSFDAFEGALLHRNSLGSETLLLDPTPPSASTLSTLKVGETFIEPTTGSELSVLEANNNELVVDINYIQPELVAPVVNIISPLSFEEVSESLDIRADVTDNTGIAHVDITLTDYLTSKRIQIQNPLQNSPFIATTQMDVSDLHNGNWYLHVSAEDLLGNVGFSTLRTISILHTDDATPPTIEIIDPNENETVYSSNIHVEASATDDSGIWKVDFFLNQNNIIPVGTDATPVHSFIYDSRVFTESGPVQVMARATDLQGNTTDSEWVTVNSFNNIDLRPPEVYFDEIIDQRGNIHSDSALHGKVQLHVIAFDNVQTTKVSYYYVNHEGEEIFLNNNTRAGTSFKGQLDTATLEDGTYEVIVRAEDAAGNINEARTIIQVDNTHYCGNGIVDSGEECDDLFVRGAQDGDGCSAECKIEYCGDGIVQTTLSPRNPDGSEMLDNPNGRTEECELPGTDTCNNICRTRSATSNGGGGCSISPVSSGGFGSGGGSASLLYLLAIPVLYVARKRLQLESR